MDLTLDLIAFFDVSGTIRYANPALLKLLEASSEEVVGASGEDWTLPSEERTLAAILADLQREDRTASQELIWAAKSGERVFAQTTFTLLFSKGQPQGMIAVGRDVTRHRMEERLFSAIQKSSLAVIESLDVNETLKNIIFVARQDLGFDRAAVWLYNEDKPSLYGAFGVDAAGNVIETPEAVVDPASFPAPFHAVLRGEMPYYFASKLPEADPVRRLLKTLVGDVEACAVVPLKWNDRILGILSVDNRITRREIYALQIDALVFLAQQAAVALAHAQWYQESEVLRASLSRQVKLFEAVHRINQVVSSRPGLHEILQQIVEQGREALGFDRAGVWLYDPEREVLQGFIGTDAQGRLVDESQRITPLHQLNGDRQALLMGEKDFITIQNSESASQGGETSAGACFQHLTVPLKSGGRVLGLLSIDNLLTSRPIEEEVIAPLQLFGGFAAMAILNYLELKEERKGARERERSLQLEAVLATVRRVNHEINNPLQALMMTLDLMELDIQRSRPIPGRRLQLLRESSERLQTVSSRLSQLVRAVFEEAPGVGSMLDLEESRKVESFS
jgi:PAS domain S-box-containing protein